MFSRISVKKPMTVLVCVVLVIILGVISFTKMTTDLLPSMDLPYVVSYTTYIGASPEQVEQGVTKPVESALATTSGVKNITSISQENVSMVILEFEQGTGMDSAMIEMTGSLDQIKGSLPEGSGSPVLMKINPDMLPIMVLAVDQEGKGLIELSEFTGKTVIPALERVDGVASVSGSGLVENQIRILMDQEKIETLNSRVLRAIDSKLADAEKELKDARKKLEDGKKELEEQSGVGYEQLVQAAQTLEDGKSQSSMAATVTGAEVTALEALLAEYEDMLALQAEVQQNDAAVQSALTAAEYAQLAALQQQRARYQTDYRTAQATLTASEATIGRIQNDHPDLAAEIAAAEQSLDTAKGAYDPALAAAKASAVGTEWEELTARESAAKTEITEHEANIEALNAQIAAETNQLTAAGLRATLRSEQEQLAAARAELQAVEAAEAAYLAENDADFSAAAEDLQQKQTALDSLKAQKTVLEEAGSAKASAEATIAQYEAAPDRYKDDMLALAGGDAAKKAAIENWITTQDKLAEKGMTAAELDALITELEPRIPAIRTELETAKSSQKDLEKALEELNKAQIKLETGKMTASAEIIKATLQLEQAEAALEEGEAQFKEQRDAAYDAAGLDGILTQQMIAQMLVAQNFSMPAGYLTGAGVSTTVKVGEQFASVEQLRDWVLFQYDVGDIGAIRLGDIADVHIADNAEDLYAKINGNDGVLLTIQKSSIASTSAACDHIYTAIEKLEEQYPGLHLTALSDQGQYIDLVVGSVLENLLFGAVLAVIILMMFLKDLRPTMIVAISIPISLLLAVVLMYFTGVTLNIISLSGLALGVGMLVDNSVVAIENIYRLRGLGYSAAAAAVHGCRQIAGAIAASTLTTVCVFAPILFTQGLTRQLFADMGLTIAYSLGASLLVALTVVPALSSRVLANCAEQKPNRLLERIITGYEKTLRFALGHRAITLILAVALLATSAVLAVSMGTAFMPDMDSPQVSVSITMPEGSTTAESRAMCDTVIDRMMEIEGIGTVGAMEGGSLFGGGEGISLYVLLEEKRSATSQQIASEIEAATADLACTVSANGSTMDMTAMTGGSGIRLKITGDDLDTLQGIAADLAGRLAAVEGIGSVSDGSEDNGAELRIIVDKNKAAEYTLTVAQVYQQVAVALSGETTATHISIEGSSLPVVVVPDADTLPDREDLASLLLTGTKNGEEVTVKLSEVAELTDAETPSAINRSNQSRTFTVSASIAEGYNIGLVSRDVEKVLADYTIPEGYDCTVDGENEMIASTMNDLILMILLAIAFIYLIMVAQFQSLLSPFIVLFTIPLAFTGGLLALWLTGMEISVIAMLGFLMLAGVIVNNGIVFVDYVNQLRLEGTPKTEALVQTGRDRIRPILMTALTTIFGLVTMAMGLGSGGDMLQPLAITTMGGLAYGTLLTLFVVPVLYDILNRRPMRKVEIEEVEE